MAGRTHGQPGAPITFGLKAASWADEVRRHLERLREGAPRWLVGQLGGAVGSLASSATRGWRSAERFCARAGARRAGYLLAHCPRPVAEFGRLLAMVTATLARIGARSTSSSGPRSASCREAAAPGAVGSITMPHKRNPEASEHLVTLARLARANAEVLTGGHGGRARA